MRERQIKNDQLIDCGERCCPFGDNAMETCQCQDCPACGMSLKSWEEQIAEAKAKQ